jgi:hypothetical protein
MDGSLMAWDLNKGMRTHALMAHVAPVLRHSSSFPCLQLHVLTVGGSAAVHSEGIYVVSGGVDGMIKLWDLRSGRVQRSIRSPTIPPGTLVHSVRGGGGCEGRRGLMGEQLAWTADGKACMCARSDGIGATGISCLKQDPYACAAVEEWDLMATVSTPRTTYTVSAPALCVRALPNGKQILVYAKHTQRERERDSQNEDAGERVTACMCLTAAWMRQWPRSRRTQDPSRTFISVSSFVAFLCLSLSSCLSVPERAHMWTRRCSLW